MSGHVLWFQKIGGAIGGGILTCRAGGAQRIAVAAGMISPIWPTEKSTAKVVVLGLPGPESSASHSLFACCAPLQLWGGKITGNGAANSLSHFCAHGSLVEQSKQLLFLHEATASKSSTCHRALPHCQQLACYL